MAKKGRGTKPKPTRLQQRAIAAIRAEITNPTGKSFVQVLKDAGYAPETARQWTNIMEGIRPHLQPTIDWMEMHRNRIQVAMEERVGKADYADLVRGLKVVTEAIQLLGGKPTTVIGLPEEDRKRLDALID